MRPSLTGSSCAIYISAAAAASNTASGTFFEMVLIRSKRLMERFGFSKKQTDAILEMKLRRLTGLERDKIENELAELRKRISFYNRDFAALCKEMIRKYGGGKFSKGIFFTVKGKKTSDGAVEFDFRDVMYREVTSYKGSKKKAATGKYASE